jgi:hypothetical protein
MYKYITTKIILFHFIFIFSLHAWFSFGIKYENCSIDVCDGRSYCSGSRYLIFGKSGFNNAKGTKLAHNIGLGNFLIFWPAAYAFAVLQNREILIYDNSIIGKVCKIVNCNFRLFSEVNGLYDDFPEATVFGFRKWLAGKRSFPKHLYGADGLKECHDWFMTNRSHARCIISVSHCYNKSLYDCLASFSLKSLFSGAFKEDAIKIASSQLIGPNLATKQYILETNYSDNYHSKIKLHCAIHVRNQLPEFEAGNAMKDQNDAIRMYMNASKTLRLIDHLIAMTLATTPDNGAVYVTSDILEMKIELSKRLSQYGFSVYYSEGEIIHSKFVARKLKGEHIHLLNESILKEDGTPFTGRTSKSMNKQDEALDSNDVSVILDWISLSKAITLLSWRNKPPKAAFHSISTFAKSARLLSHSNGYLLIDPSLPIPSKLLSKVNNRTIVNDQLWKSF